MCRGGGQVPKAFRLRVSCPRMYAVLANSIVGLASDRLLNEISTHYTPSALYTGCCSTTTPSRRGADYTAIRLLHAVLLPFPPLYHPGARSTTATAVLLTLSGKRRLLLLLLLLQYYNTPLCMLLHSSHTLYYKYSYPFVSHSQSITNIAIHSSHTLLQI